MLDHTIATRCSDDARPPPTFGLGRMLLQASLFWIPGAFIFFRVTVLSGLDKIVGDKSDSRLVVVIHEHWLDVLRGRASWRSPTFFYPTHGVLGYSDTFLLNEIFYIPLRVIGLDPFAAFQLTLLWSSLLGFVAMFALCRRVIGIGIIASAFISTLFAFATNLYIAGHTQLFAVHWLPLLALLTVRAWHASTKGRAVGWGILSGGLLGVLLFSTFYVGWFLILAGVVVGTFAAILHIEAFGPRSIKSLFRGHGCAVAGFSLGLFATFVPFLLLYLPILREFGGRHYKEAMHYAPSPAEIVNVGANNVVWGGLLRHLLSFSSLRNLETRLAVTPLVLASVVTLGVVALRRRRAGSQQGLKRSILAMACAVVVLVALPVRLPFGSPWRVPWTVLPGASAIRAPDRVQIVTQFLACCALAMGIRWGATWMDGHFKRPRELRRGLCVAAMGALLLFEQINLAPTSFLDRSNEMHELATARAVPSGCRSFFVVDTATPRKSMYESSTDAMLVSQYLGIPTINGYSGQYPIGYGPDDPSADNYLQKVEAWAIQHNVTERLCSYDPVHEVWNSVQFDPGGTQLNPGGG